MAYNYDFSRGIVPVGYVAMNKWVASFMGVLAAKFIPFLWKKIYDIETQNLRSFPSKPDQRITI